MAAGRIGNYLNYCLELFHSSELTPKLWSDYLISSLARVPGYSSVLACTGPLNKSYTSKTFLLLQGISVPICVFGSYPRKLVVLSSRE